jgi:hypothetical protein
MREASAEVGEATPEPGHKSVVRVDHDVRGHRHRKTANATLLFAEAKKSEQNLWE